MRRFLNAVAVLLFIIPLGLAVRFAPLHLPWFLYKYLGSCLWAAALCWFLAALFPRLAPGALAAIAAVIALAVELSRLVPIPAVDAFRLTLAGRILLGRYFSLKNIAAYWIAIAASALLDRYLLFDRGRSAGGKPQSDV